MDVRCKAGGIMPASKQHPLAFMGEYQLLLGVVDQALKDLHSPDKRVQADAEEWFAAESMEPWGYGWVKEILEEEPLSTMGQPDFRITPGTSRPGGVAGIHPTPPPASGVDGVLEEERTNHRLREAIRLRRVFEGRIAGRYGLTREAYERRVSAVEGKCQRCGERPGRERTPLTVASSRVYLHCLGEEMVCFRCLRKAGQAVGVVKLELAGSGSGNAGKQTRAACCGARRVR